VSKDCAVVENASFLVRSLNLSYEVPHNISDLVRNGLFVRDLIYCEEREKVRGRLPNPIGLHYVLAFMYRESERVSEWFLIYGSYQKPLTRSLTLTVHESKYIVKSY